MGRVHVMTATTADIVNLQIWSDAKRRYQASPSGRLIPWERLSPLDRQIEYAKERVRQMMSRGR